MAKIEKFIEYGWWVLIIAPLVFAFGVYVNNGYKITNEKTIEEIANPTEVSMEQVINEPVCPDVFKDAQAEIISFLKWSDKFSSKYPNVSLEQISAARIDFYVENNCVEAFKRHDDFLVGKMDEETKQLIEIATKQKVLQKKTAELMNAKKYEQVVSLNKEYIKNYPKNLDAWVNVAIAYYYLGDCDNAVAYAEHVNTSYSPYFSYAKFIIYEDLLPDILSSDICKDK